MLNVLEKRQPVCGLLKLLMTNSVKSIAAQLEIPFCMKYRQKPGLAVRLVLTTGSVPSLSEIQAGQTPDCDARQLEDVRILR